MYARGAAALMHDFYCLPFSTSSLEPDLSHSLGARNVSFFLIDFILDINGSMLENVLLTVDGHQITNGAMFKWNLK